MIKDSKKLTDLVTKLKINIEQFWFLYLVYLEETENIYKYENEIKWKDKDIRDLENRGFIINRNSKTLEIDNFTVTALFYESFLIDSDDAFDELFEVYWKWMIVKDRRIPARNGNPDELAIKYGKAIKNDPIKHKEIIDKIIKAKTQQDFPFVALEKFIEDKRWRTDFEEDGTINENNYGEKLI